MATVTPKPLVQGVLIPAVAAGDPGQYKVPAGTTAIIHSITLTNVDTVDHTVRIHLVKSGDTEGNKNMIDGRDFTVQAGKSMIDDTLRAMLAGDYISAFADQANQVALRVDGSEVQ